MSLRPWPLVAVLFLADVMAQNEPTAEETAVLCWVNRFRRDPAGTLGRPATFELGKWSRQQAEASLQAAKHAFAGTVVETRIQQAQVVDPLARSAAAARARRPGAERGKLARALVSDIERQWVGITNADLWRVLVVLRAELLAL
ncbi:MAG: hypothetical protein IPK26_10695 [Planctomycetes bacterium]|nr:hypothetical protein [Planctomycetota bacterium]